MIYVFISYDCYPLPLAKHLLDEGNDIIYGMVRSRNQLRVPGLKEDEKKEERHERLSNYSGILEKYGVDEILKHLKGVKPEDQGSYFFFFDFNDMYKISEAILKMGFKVGLFPTELYYRMEKERILGKRFVEKYYPDVKVAKWVDFKKVEEGVKHINETDKIFVLKSNGNAGRTVVPKTDDLRVAREQLILRLQEDKRDYEAGGFLLEEKIEDCLEVTPIILFWNGEPVYSIVELENKNYGAGNIGVQKGGNQALSIRTALDCEINKISFPPVIHKMAKHQPGLSIYDAGLLYNGKEFYFTEFCAMRYGWDGIFSEIVMRDTGKPFVSAYFEDIMAARNPLKNKYGASVRIFDAEGDYEDTFDPVGGKPIKWPKSIDNYLFLYSARKEDEEIVNTADRDFIAAVAGSGNTLKDAVKKTYERVKQVEFDMIFYRPEFDFMSTDYATSIPNRIKAVEAFI